MRIPHSSIRTLRATPAEAMEAAMRAAVPMEGAAEAINNQP
jgi:hypothetical protein